MLISEAYAQAAGAGGMADMATQFLPIVLIFVVFYFLLIRPQQKRAKEHKAMIEAVRRGDVVTTSGGIVGKVAKVQEDGLVQLEIAEGVKIKVVKATIAEVRSKGAGDDDADSK
jgi:preprotein translocase subunit YajC